MASPDPLEDPSRWLRELRRHHEGTCLAGDRAVAMRFVLEPGTGHLVVPVEGWVLDHHDLVIFCPEERHDALQLMLEVVGEACGGAQDRWSAYHGMARERCWLAARVTGVRREGDVCDAELAPANPFGRDEPRLVRLLNARREELRRACKRLTGVDVPDACGVGVDPFGIDVRARFGVVRAEFPVSCCPERGLACADDAAALVERLLRDEGAP